MSSENFYLCFSVSPFTVFTFSWLLYGLSYIQRHGTSQHKFLEGNWFETNMTVILDKLYKILSP